jgi:hypothetical protein
MATAAFIVCLQVRTHCVVTSNATNRTGVHGDTVDTLPFVPALAIHVSNPEIAHSLTQVGWFMLCCADKNWLTGRT